MTDKQFIKRVLARLKAYERTGSTDEIVDLFPLRDQYLSEKEPSHDTTSK